MKPERRSALASFNATRDAVAPMAISPHPAGNAKTLGRIPYAANTTKTKPARRQLCTNVSARGFSDMLKSRNAADRVNHTRNATVGASTAMPRASGGAPGPVLYRCNAEAAREKTNQAAISAVVSFAYRDMGISSFRDR